MTLQRYSLDKAAPGMFKSSDGAYVKHAEAQAQIERLAELVRISIGNIRSLGPAGALAKVEAPYEVWLSQLEAAYVDTTGRNA